MSVEIDLGALLTRIRQRQYPESMPVLVSFWLKTIYAQPGHNLGWWKELNRKLKELLGQDLPDEAAREPLREAQAWIENSLLLTGKAPEVPPRESSPFRTNLTSDWMAPYVVRLLNEWLPAEVASLLTDDGELEISRNDGIPVLAVGRALERLLVRERLSPDTLELLLDPKLLTPRYVYPADLEILRDIVLYLLGRTAAPVPPVMPATLLRIATGSSLPADYEHLVRKATLVSCPSGEELHVPIATQDALEILKGDPVRIGSVLVTLDGRCWQSEKMQSGEPSVVIYRSFQRLRIDYSGEHTRLALPWPEMELTWPGPVHLRETFEIFGRQWHGSSWEIEGEHSWFHLEFARSLKMAAPAAAGAGLQRSHPASVDMAWAALEQALAAAFRAQSSEPLEQLRHPELIPLGRAVFALAEAMTAREAPKTETLETQLKGIRYFEAETSSLFGKIPWKILPYPVREALLKRRLDPVLLELLATVFDDLPAAFDEGIRRRPASSPGTPTTPSQAA